MAREYRVEYRGLTVFCDSLDEIDRMADRLEARQPTRGGRIRDLVAEMGDGPQKLLEILLDEPGPRVPGSTLCKRMNLDDNQLAGKVTGVTEPVKKAGFSPVLLSAVSNGSGRREYWLDPEAVEEVREGLRKK